MACSPPHCIEWSSACFWWRNVCLMGRVIYCQRRCSGAHTVIQWARKTCNSDWNKNLLREAREQKKSRGGMLGVLKVWKLQQNKFESDPSTQCRVAWPCPVKRRCDITSPFWWLKRVSTIYASPLSMGKVENHQIASSSSSSGQLRKTTNSYFLFIIWSPCKNTQSPIVQNLWPSPPR